jgi:hypothetical protein
VSLRNICRRLHKKANLKAFTPTANASFHLHFSVRALAFAGVLRKNFAEGYLKVQMCKHLRLRQMLCFIYILAAVHWLLEVCIVKKFAVRALKTRFLSFCANGKFCISTPQAAVHWLLAVYIVKKFAVRALKTLFLSFYAYGKFYTSTPHAAVH